MEKVYEKYKDKIDFVGVNIAMHESPKKVKKYIKEKKLTFPMAYDKHKTLRKLFSVAGVPAVIIIDSTGIVKYIGVNLPNDFKSYL